MSETSQRSQRISMRATVSMKMVLSFAVAASAAVAGCSSCSKSSSSNAPGDAGAPSAAASASSSAASAPSASASSAPIEEKLTIEDVTIGTGAEAKVGDHISIHYVATLAESGKEFDSSRARKQPFDLDAGTGRVIRGWDQGMLGMRVGGTRRVTIPPSFGYGEAGAPPLIPPKSTLIFEIELLSVKRSGKPVKTAPGAPRTAP